MRARSTVVTVTGRDAPGISGRLFGALVPLRPVVLDVEQVQIRGTLILCIELEGDPDVIGVEVRRALTAAFSGDPLRFEVAGTETGRDETGHDETRRDETRRDETGRDETRSDGRGVDGAHLVTFLSPVLGADVLASVFGHLASTGANVDRIRRLSAYPVASYQLTVSGVGGDDLRREVAAIAALDHVDIAVQRAGLHRRARHLVVLDADSTLLQGEVIDLIAAKAGRGPEVSAITASAMDGALDFAQALEARLARLAGTPSSVLDDVRAELVLAPGARTLLRTLKRLGYATAVVSGGFVQVIEPLARELGVDYVAANTLDIAEGRLTGRVVGAVVDRVGKATALARFADQAGVPMSQTIAIGDGANDIDMLGAAGLGVAFNAKPVVRRGADAALNVPFLDAVLFFLGISREEIEAADRAG